MPTQPGQITITRPDDWHLHLCDGNVLAALPKGMHFEPLMTLYLTETTSPEDIAEAKASGFIHAVKYYPVGATTHSDAGVNDLAR